VTYLYTYFLNIFCWFIWFGQIGEKVVVGRTPRGRPVPATAGFLHANLHMADILIDEVIRLCGMATPIFDDALKHVATHAHNYKHMGEGDRLDEEGPKILMLNAGSGLLPWALADAGAQVHVSGFLTFFFSSILHSFSFLFDARVFFSSFFSSPLKLGQVLIYWCVHNVCVFCMHCFILHLSKTLQAVEMNASLVKAAETLPRPHRGSVKFARANPKNSLTEGTEHVDVLVRT
jgi:hypothetical protein